MAVLGQNTILRYGHFCVVLETKMVNLGPIDFQLCLSLNINLNYGHNKFKVHISKNVAKMANSRPKIGQDATFSQTLNGHNSNLKAKL